MRELAADGIPVAKSLQVLGFSRQAFYEWEANPVSDRDWSDAHLTNAAIEIHREDPEYGYRFVADELETVGWAVSERRVWRLCSQAGLFSFHAKKRGKYTDGGLQSVAVAARAGMGGCPGGRD
ncbi:MAG TPA: transposase [Aeromicrobium sp.]|nr:transposase [Aeromicrobium sp.]HKY57887.1 transposase [Aeromicrobium sp.]